MANSRMRLGPGFRWRYFNSITTNIFRLVESEIGLGQKLVHILPAHKLSNADTASKAYLAIRGLEVGSREPTSDSLSCCGSLVEAMSTKQKTELITADAAYHAVLFSKHVG